MARLSVPKRRNKRGVIESEWSRWLDACQFRSIPGAADAIGMSPHTLKRWAHHKPTTEQRLIMAAVYHRLTPWQ